MAKDEKKDQSLWESLKTSALCVMFGAMGGGLVMYHVEDVESDQYMRVLQRELNNAHRYFEPTRDSLSQKVFFYKFHRDSLKSLLEHTRDSLYMYVQWVEQNQPKLEKGESDIQECNEINSTLESQLRSIQDSLFSCHRVNDNSQEKIERHELAINECEEKNETISLALDSVQNSLDIEQKEVRIRDNQLDSIETILNKHKNRYIMETEFALLTTCIYGHGNSMTRSQYDRQKKCCIEYIRKIQKKYPTDKDLEKIQDDFEIRNECSSSYYNDDYF